MFTKLWLTGRGWDTIYACTCFRHVWRLDELHLFLRLISYTGTTNNFQHLFRQWVSKVAFFMHIRVLWLFSIFFSTTPKELNLSKWLCDGINSAGKDHELFVCGRVFNKNIEDWLFHTSLPISWKKEFYSKGTLKFSVSVILSFLAKFGRLIFPKTPNGF